MHDLLHEFIDEARDLLWLLAARQTALADRDLAGITARDLRGELHRVRAAAQFCDQPGMIAAFDRLDEDLEEIAAGRIGRQAALNGHAVRCTALLDLAAAGKPALPAELGPWHGMDAHVARRSGDLGKAVELHVEDGGLRLDRAASRGLRHALLLAVDNALEHGIETADRRIAAAKDPVGRLVLRAARRRDGMIAIVVADDGAGLDRAAIARRLNAQGLPAPTSDAAATEALFAGLACDRGAPWRDGGLAQLRREVHALGGRVALRAHAGEGLYLAIDVPLARLVIQPGRRHAGLRR